MRNAVGMLPLLVVAAAMGYVVGAARFSANAAPSSPKENACGCYQDGTGACYCGKKAKCGCPGECEPRGCEEKRAKELEKEIQAETKRAQEADRKHREARAPKEEPKKKATEVEEDDDEGESDEGASTRATPPARRSAAPGAQAAGQCPPCPCAAEAKKPRR